MRSNVVKLTVISIVMLPLLLLLPQRSRAISGDDGSLWVRVNPPGFGSNNNMSVVAMAEYNGYLYAMTRNQQEGTEVWRTGGTGWEQVLFPDGETNGIYGNTQINNVWARMIVFNGKLYFGFSSGLQGNYLGSTGAEIWRYDGSTWEAVISDKRDTEESGTITGIAGCATNDGVRTADITDSAKAWTPNEWAGGVLQITSGAGIYRRFLIVSNTATTLTVQQNETAGTYSAGVENEYTNCSSAVYNNPFPSYSYTLGAVTVGNTYEIGLGNDENGFGDFWNKTITAMRLFDNKLYVSTGLNYEYGGQIWYTEDGDNWIATPSVISISAPYNYHSFGNFHPNTAYPGGYKPVSSSVSDLTVSSVSGTPVLYAGGTGTSGDLGGCARMARLTEFGWELIVDNAVDVNATGSNENGFGSPPGCGTNQYNFMPWSLADFDNNLMVGVVGYGARVLHAQSGVSEIKDDGSWQYAVGEANVDPADPLYVDPLGDSPYPNGFDGYTYPTITPNFGVAYQNLAVNLFPFNNTLYGGIICQYVPEFNTPVYIDEMLGSQIWKSSDVTTWTQVTGNGFGDPKIINFEGFAVFGSHLYVAGSKGASSTPSGLGGAKVFKQLNGLPDDRDEDGVSDSADNCPSAPNTASMGTCTSGYLNVICTSNAHCGTGGVCSTSQEDGDSDGVGNACDNCAGLANPTQVDSFPPGGNGCGNACECESDFNSDGKVDGSDAAAFKADFGRTSISNPCTNTDLCNGDFGCNGDVSGTDAALFKSDFGRSSFNNPCPRCETPRWCWY